LENTSGATLASLGDSGFVPVPGGRRIQFWLAVLFTVVPFVFLMGLLATIILSAKGVISLEFAMLLLFVLLLLHLIARMPHAWLLKAYLSSRADGLLRAFESLPRKAVGLEDGRTFKKTKLVIEDAGVCLLDSTRHRLLLECCQFRYVFYAKDILSVEPVSTFSLSGARLNCRVGEHYLDLVFSTVSPGPLASLIQAFAPSEGAKGLATELNRTLFGKESPSYKQGSLPPPLPSSAPPEVPVR
jgi:hypothetical protein